MSGGGTPRCRDVLPLRWVYIYKVSVLPGEFSQFLLSSGSWSVTCSCPSWRELWPAWSTIKAGCSPPVWPSHLHERIGRRNTQLQSKLTEQKNGDGRNCRLALSDSWASHKDQDRTFYGTTSTSLWFHQNELSKRRPRFSITSIRP